MIIIDTNFILTCVKQKIDMFEQLKKLEPGKKIAVPSNVLEELTMLRDSKKLKMSEREAADIAIQLVDKENVIILDLQGNVDDSIVRYVGKNDIIVASLDRGIIRRLKGARFLTILRKSRIARV
jgi:rRNA-processing protein FCF1